MLKRLLSDIEDSLVYIYGKNLVYVIAAQKRCTDIRQNVCEPFKALLLF